MNLVQKQEIHKLLISYLGDNEKKNVSQKQAISHLKDVSEATIIAMRDMKWNGMSDQMWRTVGIELGWKKKRNFFVETLNAMTLIMYFDVAKQHGEFFAIVGPEGSGKTESGEFYTQAMRGKNVWYLQCAEYWNKKYFLCEILRVMGKKSEGLNVYEMMETIVYELRRQDSPLFIVDEIDKLKPEVLLFFITLYNKLHRMCGVVWMSTDTIVSDIQKGIRKAKKGYRELFSRIGKSYIYLDKLDSDEIKQVCLANGIDEAPAITTVQNECEGDIRRLDRNYLKAEMKNNLLHFKDRVKQLTTNIQP